MPKQVTIAASNRYCQARLRAAKYNDDFSKRSTAVDHIPGVTEDSLKKYELDTTRPPNIVVALMADAYNAPELRAWYCSNECPLGRDRREIPDAPPERILIRLINATKDVSDISKALERIMDDGIIDEQEAAEIPMLRSGLLEARRRMDEILSVLEKAEKTGSIE